MKIQPFGERVVIRVMEPYQMSDGGLLMASSKEQSNRGLVEAVGDEVEYMQVGDVVIFNLGAGVGYTSGSDDYRILNKRDILGKLEKEE